jgi:hypothetical protein
MLPSMASFLSVGQFVITVIKCGGGAAAVAPSSLWGKENINLCRT